MIFPTKQALKHPHVYPDLPSMYQVEFSHPRYLRYVNQLIWEPKTIPHKRPLFLKTVTMSPVPFFNKARSVFLYHISLVLNILK